MTARPLLRHDRRAVTAVEFAIVLPALLTLICGTLELGHLLFARTVLDGAVIDASRIATASLETSEEERDAVLRDSIIKSMEDFPLADGRSMTIVTKVYRDFSTSYPESYDDVDGNGQHDLNEPYVDRNRNGEWDPAEPIEGTLGGPGDVVSYTAIYPKKILFDFLARPLGLQDAITISATTVVRNESVRRKDLDE
ncbi:TadE/TadG family type IV pilus assembly protein [Stakelama saccharophila]|uniref:Pilus assembly protein n=1 Tax=Stakelama saccharophila TaxID=3075605 RepID=A0ABZ0BCD0_9SPHN|nr:pilus assembly protein [Stakelama sp. W311]WNO55049.1 pilus assembly protein [Stakelama sp. W311]